jgi:hypothetical protein
MPTHSPPFLNVAEETLLGSAIEKRMKVHALMTGPISNIIGTRLLSQTKVNAPLQWVGGSRSWDYLVHNAHVPLTPIEAISVAPGNWDIFFAGRNESETRQIANDMCTFAKGLLTELKAVMGNNYKWTMETRGFKARTCIAKDTLDVMGESFPGYGVLLYVEGPEGERVLALYLEVFCFDNVDARIFKQAYLHDEHDSLTYLNQQGIFLFHHMIKDASRRNEKGYDVDMHRRNILMKLSQNRAAMYIECAKSYRAVWSGFGPNVFDPAFEAQLYLNAFDISAAREDFEKRIIEVWRPAINACIAEIDAMLRSLYGEDVFVMITGGDAMRRYDPSIAGSKDIDAKVFYRAGTGPIILGKIAELMSNLTYQAIVHKHATFEMMGNAKGQMTAPLGQHVSITYLMPELDPQLQFRLRYIEKSKDWPVDLYSIDYRAILNATIAISGAASQTFHVPLDVPIFDVTLQENTQGLTRPNVVRLFDGLPVANEKVLFEDLKAIYENKMLARARLLGAKRDKDKARFRALRSFLSAPVPNHLAGGLNVTDIDIMKGTSHKVDAAKYFKKFQALVKAEKRRIRNPITQHEMPFDIQDFPWPKQIEEKMSKPTKPTKMATDAKPRTRKQKRRYATSTSYSSMSSSWDPSSNEKPRAMPSSIKRNRKLIPPIAPIAPIPPIATIPPIASIPHVAPNSPIAFRKPIKRLPHSRSIILPTRMIARRNVLRDLQPHSIVGVSQK